MHELYVDWLEWFSEFRFDFSTSVNTNYKGTNFTINIMHVQLQEKYSGAQSIDSKARMLMANSIKIFFDYAYYVGLSPVKIIYDFEAKKYCKRNWKPQQVIYMGHFQRAQ